MECAQFSFKDLFAEDAEEDGPDEQREPSCDVEEEFVQRSHAFPGGHEIVVREFSFHSCNANLLWPGSLSFAQWLWERPETLRGQRVLELGSGTGALSIFLHKHMGCDITTSDYEDPAVQENIATNCMLNDIAPLPHIPHTWGNPFPVESRSWPIIIASDILLYVKQYANLLSTLKHLLQVRPGVSSTVSKAVFIMSWKRRIPKNEERKFFDGCFVVGLKWKDLGCRVFEIVAA